MLANFINLKMISRSNKLPTFLKRVLTIVPMLLVVMMIVVETQLAQSAATKATQAQNGGRLFGSALATKRLMKEFKDVQESDSVRNGVFTAELVDDNIFEWHVKLYKVGPDSRLNYTLMESKRNGGVDHIKLQIKYSDDYPFSPPFVRVVYPYLAGVAMYGNGVICSQLLTEEGWASSYTIEPLILQLSATLCEGNAFVDLRYAELRFTYEEARESFEALSKKGSEDWSWPDKS
uniref:Ubiquitin-conjugating enzyme E2 Q2 n=1 Tax=Aceria tosichella TaxID=561515 RepID=A0A6G1SB25_9ACAR